MHPAWQASLLTVFVTTLGITVVTQLQSDLPLVSSLDSMQIPLCLFVYVLVKSLVQRMTVDVPVHTPSLSEVYACLRIVISEVYASFVVLIIVKLYVLSA